MQPYQQQPAGQYANPYYAYPPASTYYPHAGTAIAPSYQYTPPTRQQPPPYSSSYNSNDKKVGKASNNDDKKSVNEWWWSNSYTRAKASVSQIWNTHFYKIMGVFIVTSIITLVVYAVLKRRRAQQAEKEKALSILKKMEAINVYEEEEDTRVSNNKRHSGHLVKLKIGDGGGDGGGDVKKSTIRHGVSQQITMLIIHPPHFVFKENVASTTNARKKTDENDLDVCIERFTECLYLLFHLAERPKQIKVVALCFTPNGDDLNGQVLNVYRHKCKHQTEPNFATQINLHYMPYSKWYGYNTARYELVDLVLKLYTPEEDATTFSTEEDASEQTCLILGLDSSCALIMNKWDNYIKRTWLDSYRYLSKKLKRVDVQPVLTQSPPTQQQFLQIYELENNKSARVYITERQKREDERGGVSFNGSELVSGKGIAALRPGEKTTLKHVLTDGVALLSGGGRRHDNSASVQKRKMDDLMIQLRSPTKALNVMLPGTFTKPHVDCIDQICGWIPYAEVQTPCFFDIPLMQKTERNALPTPWFDSRFYVIPQTALNILQFDRSLGNISPSAGPDFLYGLQLWSCGFVTFNPSLLLACNLYNPITSQDDVPLTTTAKRADALWSCFCLNTHNASASVLSSSAMALKAYAHPSNRTKYYSDVLALQDFVDLYGVDIWRKWPNVQLTMSTAWMGLSSKTHVLNHPNEFAYKYASELNFNTIKSQLTHYIDMVQMSDNEPNNNGGIEEYDEEVQRLLNMDDEFVSYIKTI
jgi:hypothetical protein